MRKFRDIFLAAAAGQVAMVLLALLVSACSWNIGRDYDPDVTLSFLPSVGKPGGESEPVPSEGSFGLSLWQYSLDTSSSWQLADMSSIAWDGDKWTLPSQPLWPSKHFGLQALAYSPCDAASACSLTEGVVFGDYDAGVSPTLDLLYTNPILAINKSGNGGAISLPFHHALTELSLRFIAHNHDNSIRVRELRIPNAQLRGSFHSLPTPEWSFTGDAETLKFGCVTDFLSSVPLGIPSIFLPPQSLSEGFIVSLSYIDPLDIEREVLVQTEPLNIQLKGDRQYVFTISVDPESAIVIESGISK